MAFNLVKTAKLTYDGLFDDRATHLLLHRAASRRSLHRGPFAHHDHLPQRHAHSRRSERHTSQASQWTDVPGPRGARQRNAVRLRATRQVEVADIEKDNTIGNQ